MWDEKYSTDEFVYGKIANDFLQDSIKYIPEEGSVLCLAEGEGRNAVYLAKKGFDVSALDLSSVGRDKALVLAKDNNVTINYVVADLSKYDFGENKWDAVVSIWAHLPRELQVSVHAKIIKSLKPNGVVIFEGYSKEQLGKGTGGPKSLDLLYDLGELKNDFSELDLFFSAGLERDISEGKLHNGNSSVCQLIGIKK